MSRTNDRKFTIVIPAYNEETGLNIILPTLNNLFSNAEIIVVNDGSTDNTQSTCEKHSVTVVTHPYKMGNGASIKSGARHANTEIIVFMDADGQHSPEDIQKLLDKMDEGYEMVVGARNIKTHSTYMKRLGNTFFNKFASIMTGHTIPDLTSGLRAVNAKTFRKFLYLLPNGFSYPTTSTMAFFRSGNPVGYISIKAGKRTKGTSSNIKVIKDGIRFFVIILKIGALYSPMRLFLPISLGLFVTGIGYYAYTYFTDHRFTNMSALLFISALMIFLIGILSEQVSSLHYRDSES